MEDDGPPRDTVAVSRATLQDILLQARCEAPRECCGLLVGHGLAVHGAVPTRNIAEGVSRYQVDPREHLALLRRLRGTPQTIIGAYHSHPASPASPSVSDVREAFERTFVYLIVSLAPGTGPEWAAFRVRDNAPELLALHVRG